MGNRLHLAYKRQVTTEHAQAFAERLGVTFFEVSPLCNFNITESFTELARIVLMRHGMERLWRPNKGNKASYKQNRSFVYNIVFIYIQTYMIWSLFSCVSEIHFCHYMTFVLCEFLTIKSWCLLKEDIPGFIDASHLEVWPCQLPVLCFYQLFDVTLTKYGK